MLDGVRRSAAQPLFWVCLILAVALAAGYLMRPQGGRANQAVRSSLRTTPDGVAALARAIERLGRRTRARMTPLADAEPVRGTVVLLQPVLFASPREVRALLNHVRAGGTLLYAPRYAAAQTRGAARWPLMDSLGIRFRNRPLGEALREAEDLETRWADHRLASDLPAPGPAADGVRLASDGDTAATLPPPVTDTLLTAVDEDGTEWIGAAVLRIGEGRAVIVADARPLSNEHAANDPLAILAIRAVLAYTPESDTVFFAEYHQGIRSDVSSAQVLADFFLGNPAGRALGHVVAVCVLALAFWGMRFGSPTPAIAPPDRERRSPLEHVSALGDLYRQSGADGTAALLMLGRLARSARRPPPRDVDEADALLGALDSRPGADAPLARVRRALHADPIDLPNIAAGIDEHLSRRKTT